MRVFPFLAAALSVAFLSACNEDKPCTAEEMQQKSAELTTKISDLATKDPAKMAELAPKVQEIATKAAAGGDDLAAACKAMDEMMAELSK